MSRWVRPARGNIAVMGPRAEVVRELLDAIDSLSLVRIRRFFCHADTVDGFPLWVGSKWVLISQTRDGGFFNGMLAVRLKDITKVRRDATFGTRFAQTQSEWPPTMPALGELDTTGGLIKGLSQKWPLISIEQERKHHSPMMWIGIVDELVDGWLWLREVRPDATWRKHPRGYKLKHITKVVVADQYLTALSAVAGFPTRCDHPQSTA